ncbi:hypothetical protein JAAARDRAFT_183837 [Jaapia argillacea MUCL 33604]|uniref:Probable RNA-binding protein 18 n=1 Tax=Jaapia argillacea MUCL 33604 TaxID=933084 RepID=A0A067PDQ6_9AGAM|nr:hypothetical protein JAAARDRAFT_183837 [Jaapia argillacea MUCL 33604]
METHLSYPAPSQPTASSSSSTKAAIQAQPRPLLKDRLYVGNLHPTVDEYTLIQLFSKYGKISKLDYLFHKSGPLKGKPRGYAFIEYASQYDANKALQSTNDKLLRGRKLVVTNAQQAPLDLPSSSTTQPSSSSGSWAQRKAREEMNKPTTLSLIKGVGGSGRREGTKDKIAMMEAKLRQMERSSASNNTPTPPSNTNQFASTSSSSSTLPPPPSTLPPKPLPQQTKPILPAPNPPPRQKRKPKQTPFASLLKGKTKEKILSPTEVIMGSSIFGGGMGKVEGGGSGDGTPVAGEGRTSPVVGEGEGEVGGGVDVEMSDQSPTLEQKSTMEQVTTPPTSIPTPTEVIPPTLSTNSTSTISTNRTPTPAHTMQGQGQRHGKSRLGVRIVKVKE